ncbi:MAG: acyltransferase [Bacteroidetes bacterium]|nr:acyltransferase [Bacteroidota bacterium]
MTFIRNVRNTFLLHPDYESRVFGLDIMRALAIIFVVLEHGLMLDKVNTTFPWIKLISGVELFFVLSGFLIGGMLIRIFEKSESFGLRTMGNFWIRRWFRTLPNYYLVLLINIFIVYFGIIHEDFSQFNWKFFFFLQNFSGPFAGFFWESWSLSIEEWFYLIFPLLLWLMFLLMKAFRVQKKHMFLAAILVLLFVPLLLRIFIAGRFMVNEYNLGAMIQKVVIYRLDSIALGILAAYIHRWHPAFWHRVRNASFIVGLVACYIILYLHWPPNLYFTKVFRIFLESFCCFLMLPKFESIRKGPKVLVRFFTHISLISYSMYLLNLAVIAEVINANFPPHNDFSAWALYCIYWGLVLIFSTLLYKYYEKPVMDLRDRFRKKTIDAVHPEKKI